MSNGLVPDQARGSWEGSNSFRLMPGDPFSEAPAAGTLALAAGGCLATFGYTWTHPEDGDQDGLLAFGLASPPASAAPRIPAAYTVPPLWRRWEGLLASRDRGRAGDTAPRQGRTLVSGAYP